MAFYLGLLYRGFKSEEVVRDYDYNADETQFVVDLNDRRTIAMKGDKNAMYNDEVSGGHGMTMIVMLGRELNTQLPVPTVIFQNYFCSH